MAGTAAGAFWATESGAFAGRAPPARTPPPTAASGVYDITHFGAFGDGKTPSTDALQKAIDACGAAGGGMVLVPPGRYLSGAVFLRSHVNVHLLAGATIVASSRQEDFPPIKGRDEGIERTIHSSLFTGIDLENVSITGHGVIDGGGEPWWEAHVATLKLRVDAKLAREADNPPGSPLQWPRPRTINLIRCRYARIEGITIQDAPFYTVHVVYCQDVAIEGLAAWQRRSVYHTAITIDSSKRVRIAGCVLGHGGNGIGLKAGYNEDGRRVNLPTEDILISNCQVTAFSEAAIAIGSETSGSIRNIVIDSCTIVDALNGVYIRSPRGRGGTVEQIRVSNLVMDKIREVAIRVTHFYDSVRLISDPFAKNATKGTSARRDLEISRSRKEPVNEGTPTFRNFAFSGISLGKVRNVALIEGLPERFVRGMVLEDISATEAKAGISCALAADVRIGTVTLDSVQSPAVDAREVERLEVHRLSQARPGADTPSVWLENVAGAFIHGCSVGTPRAGYEWLRQEQCRGVTLAGNDVPAPLEKKT